MYIEFVYDFKRLSKFVLRVYALQRIINVFIGYGARRGRFFPGEHADPGYFKLLY